MHYAIRSSIKPGLECYLLSVPPARLFGLLGHDPRSQFWKNLPEWLRTIYEQKQRVTLKARIDALDLYIRERLMVDDKVAAFPPISVCQFEPFVSGAVKPLDEENDDVVRVNDDNLELTRILIDGLARVTSMNGTRDDLRSTNVDAYHRLDQFRFTVALYAPTDHAIGRDVAGQLFTDFNSYAWAVPTARSIAADQYNPYKQVASLVAASDVLKRHGGLKVGSSNLGKKDTAFTTQLVMAQFAKIAIEGRRGYGTLTRPVSDPLIATTNLPDAAAHIVAFFEGVERKMGMTQFADRTQIWRTAHGLYALAVVIKDISDGRTTLAAAVDGICGINWTWANPDLQRHIGRSTDGGTTYKLNTGVATLDWLIGHCRSASNVLLTPAAA